MEQPVKATHLFSYTEQFKSDTIYIMRSFDQMPWPEARKQAATYFEKYEIPLPASDHTLKVALHRLRAKSTEVSEDLVISSRQWLADYG